MAAPVWDLAKPTLGMRIHGSTQVQSWLIRMFFHYLGGRQKTFYLPTWREDFTVTQNVPNNSAFLFVENQDFVGTYGTTPAEPFKCIQITRTNNTQSRHVITNAVSAGAEEILTVDPVISPALTVAEIKMVEFLVLSRLRQDTITVTPKGAGQTLFETEAIGVLA
jgi:hypothetical protein